MGFVYKDLKSRKEKNQNRLIENSFIINGFLSQRSMQFLLIQAISIREKEVLMDLT